MFRGLSSVEALLGAALFTQIGFSQAVGGPVDSPAVEIISEGENQTEPDEKARAGPRALS